MWKVQLFELNYDNLEQQAVKEVLDSAWITMGKRLSILKIDMPNF